ncbi:carbohydrate esterase family 3 protein [Niveomyces insectorum RCEF 264]|uniref:Carbohydrate esterase family 3 protein n=1 Tax=Niveomyces insectorum RCEF 264 TaxID=1081102 RepID=A0A162MS11_9HYPO|nr:carbohydrate esterase family 3 protein [Niveomyces insectorum RCEF 264]
MHALGRLLVVAAAFAGAVVAAPGTALAAAAAQTQPIMPLGDSITEITCWRAFVWDMIATGGYADKVEYVGSQKSNPQNCKPDTANWDQHHEGHSGWLAIDIANNYLTKWLASTPADIVMFMLGTNDVVRGHTTADIMAAYTKMVGIMRAANPKMKIIVDLVIPLPLSSAGIVAINQAIPDWAAKLNSTDSPIVIADCNTGFPTSDLRDGVHPNIAGDKILASRIGPLLLNYINESLSS